MALAYPVSDQDHVWGSPEAVIELVEYGDFQCPHCGRAYPILKELKETMKDSVKFVFRNFPLSKIHPQAKSAAVAAEAAGLQKKFWEMHDQLFEHQAQLNNNALLDYASRIEVDKDKFSHDLLDDGLQQKVDSDFMGGLRSGVNGTPTFFINGERYEGNWEGNNLQQFLQAKLQERRT